MILAISIPQLTRAAPIPHPARIESCQVRPGDEDFASQIPGIMANGNGRLGNERGIKRGAKSGCELEEEMER